MSYKVKLNFLLGRVLFLLFWLVYLLQGREDLGREDNVKALFIQNYSIENFAYYIEKNLTLENPLTVKEVSVCFWIKPMITSSGTIFVIKAGDHNGLILKVELLENKLSFSTNNEIVFHSFDVDFGEWQHFSVMYGTSIKIVKTIPGDLENSKLNISVEELKISDTSRLTVTVGEDFPSEMGPMIIIGVLADIRLYFSTLSDTEINTITNFKNVSKEFYSLLDNTNSNSSVPFTYIPQHHILNSASHNDFLWYFDIKVQCKQADSFCKKFNGSLPNVNSDLEDLKNYLITHESICTFWMLSNDDSCYKAYYSKSSRNITLQLINDTRLALICIIPKHQKFFFKDDSNELTFYPEPFETLNFYNSDENLFLYYSCTEKQFFTFKIFYDYTTKISDYVPIINVMGRYNWTYIDNGNSTNRAIFSVCFPGLFTCTNGECIEMRFVCDYQNHCNDNSDEENCEHGIIPKGFYRSDLPPENYTTISLTMLLQRVLSINLEENTIGMCLTLTAEWYDKRLNFKYLRYKVQEQIRNDIADIYWSPRIKTVPVVSNNTNAFFLDSNMGEVWAELQVESHKTEVFYGYEVHVSKGENVKLVHMKTSDIIFQCTPELFYYPFDSNECKFNLSLFSSDYFTVIWDEINVNSTMYLENALPALYTGLKFSGPIPNGNMSELTYTIGFARKYQAYVLNTLLPCVILDVIGFFTFFMPYDDYNDRVTTTLSCLIVLASLFAQLSTTSPESSDPKLIDIWMFAHILVLFVVFIFNCIVIWLENKSKKARTPTRYEKNLKRGNHDSLVPKTKNMISVAPYHPMDMNLKYEVNFADEEDGGKKSYEKANIIGLIVCSLCYILFLILFFYCAFAKPISVR